MQNQIISLKDNFGNSGTIEEKMLLPYRGATAREPGFVLTLWADYDGGLTYHVSVHPSLGDALEIVKTLSCGTFRAVTSGVAA